MNKEIEQNNLRYNILDKEVQEIEKKIEDKMLLTTKRHDAVFSRNKDWGYKAITIQFILDEVNIAEFSELMNDVKLLMEKRREKRLEQINLEFAKHQIELENKVQERIM